SPARRGRPRHDPGLAAGTGRQPAPRHAPTTSATRTRRRIPAPPGPAMSWIRGPPGVDAGRERRPGHHHTRKEFLPMIDPAQYRKAAYLKASDLQATQTRVRIHSVTEEEVGTPAELKVVLQFTSDKLKPLIVNYTNCVTLVEGFGTDEHQWIGKVIILVKTKTI